MAGEFFALGDIDIDLTVPVTAPPALGEEVYAPAAEATVGGSAVNTCRVLAALGHRAQLLAAVGDDEWGRRAVRTLEAAAVGTRWVEVGEGHTGLSVIMVSPGGERTMVGVRGANRSYRGVDGWEEGCSWLHLSAYALLHGGQRRAALAALATARDRGIPVSVDVPSGVAGERGERLLADLGEVRCLSTGRRSVEAITGGGGVPALLGAGIGLVAVTEGATAVEVTTPRVSWRLTPPAVEAVDTTGAGDWFVAGLISALYRGLEAGPAAVVATALGTASVLSPGSGTDQIGLRLRRVFAATWSDLEPGWMAGARHHLSDVVDSQAQ